MGEPAVLGDHDPVVVAVPQGPEVEPPDPAGRLGRAVQVDGVEVDAGEHPAERQPGLVGVRHRKQHAGRAGGVVLAVAAAVAEDVDVDPVPAEAPPQDRLHDPDALDAVDRDGLAGQAGQAAGGPQPAGRLGQGEVEHADHPGADHGDQADGHGDQRGQGEADHVEDRRDGEEHDQADDGHQPLAGQQEAADQALRGDGHQALVGRAQVGEDAGGRPARVADAGVLAMGPGQQVVAEPVGLGPGQVVQLDHAVAGADLHPQLGQPEQPGGERLDDVDRLQALEGDLLGALEHRSALDPQLVVVDDEAGEVPADEAGQRGQQHRAGDDEEQDPRSGRQAGLSGSPSGRSSRPK